MAQDDNACCMPPEVFRARMLWREAFRIASLLRDPTSAGMEEIAGGDDGEGAGGWVLGAFMLADCIHDLGRELPTSIAALEILERGGGMTTKQLDCHPARASLEETEQRLKMLEKLLVPSDEDIERGRRLILKLELTHSQQEGSSS